VRTLPPYPEPEVLVPQGHVWVEGSFYTPSTPRMNFALGDAFHSQDSNSFGPASPLILN
jgi:inner membrane protease subunit 2